MAKSSVPDPFYDVALKHSEEHRDIGLPPPFLPPLLAINCRLKVREKQQTSLNLYGQSWANTLASLNHFFKQREV